MAGSHDSDMVTVVKDVMDDQWKISYMQQTYSIESMPDPGCAPVQACVSDLRAGGLDPADLVYMISKTIACVKIGLNGFAAAGDWTAQDEFYNKCVNLSKLLQKIETSMGRMKTATDDILDKLQIAVLYTVKGHDKSANEIYGEVSSKASKLIEEFEPLAEELDTECDELRKSKMYQSKIQKLQTLSEAHEKEDKQLKTERRNTEEEQIDMDRKVADVDRDIAAAEDEWFKWARGTKERIKEMNKERRQFLQKKEDMERKLQAMKEDLDQKINDAGFLVLPVVLDAMRSMTSYLQSQKMWWSNIIDHLKPKLEAGSTLVDDVNVRSVFKLKFVKMYFMLVAVRNLTFHSQKYMHRCNEEFGKATASSPNQKQGLENLRPLIENQQNDTNALMEGIKTDLQQQIQEYEIRQLSLRSPASSSGGEIKGQKK